MHGINLLTAKGLSSYSRRSKRRIAGYATVAATKKTSIKTSGLSKLFRARSLGNRIVLFSLPKIRSLYFIAERYLPLAGN